MSMRPVHLTYTVATVSTTGIATGLTGAGPFTTFTASGPGDGLAHVISLTSGANLSGINLTVRGIDADGQTISEVIAGPNINTITTTALFKQLTSITAASTLGANTLDVGWTAVSNSPTIPLEFYVQGMAPAVQVALTGTANFDVEITLSNLHSNEYAASLQSAYTWLNDANFTNKSASLAAHLAVTATALRLALNSYSTGAILTMSIITAK